MRIIEEQPFEIEFTCTLCKSHLAAGVDDIVGKRVMDGWSETRVMFYAVCPVCHTTHEFETSDLPTIVTRKVQ